MIISIHALVFKVRLNCYGGSKVFISAAGKRDFDLSPICIEPIISYTKIILWFGDSFVLLSASPQDLTPFCLL